MTQRCISVVGILFLVLVGCEKKDSSDKVTRVSGDDAKMNAAIAKSRATTNTFIAALKSPKPGQVAFSVKKPFVEGEHVEHMWLTDVTFDGSQFTGLIGNEPEVVKNVKIGQKATVSPSEISDWMFIENRKLVGGETLRVLRDGLSAAERADFDKSVPFTVE